MLLNKNESYVKMHLIQNDDGDQTYSPIWRFTSTNDIVFVSEEVMEGYISQLIKINKENLLELSGSSYDPKNVNSALVDDTKTRFEKFAESIGVEIIKEEKEGFNPLDFLRN